ncbi:MAG: sel1 repeat family protein [Verrucomicrobia bacterium]|nr:sel1 repeat family protein [Verrucomicrobiota bacterium]
MKRTIPGLLLAGTLLFVFSIEPLAGDGGEMQRTWRHDWSEFMQELGSRLQSRGVSELELNAIFHGKEVNWSGRVTEIKRPAPNEKDPHIAVEMSPFEKNMAAVKLRFPYIKIYPGKRDWQTLEGIKVGSEIEFSTRLGFITAHVSLDSVPNELLQRPTPMGRMGYEGISPRGGTYSFFLHTIGLTAVSMRCKSLAELRARAENNDAQSQYELGQAFGFGRFGVTTNVVEAVKWTRKAAEQNHARSQFILGRCCFDGIGTTMDKAEAVKWHRKAAEQNYADAQYILGFVYGFGQGLRMDATEALKWLHRAAEQDHPGAQYYLAFFYSTGRGVKKDETEAVKWFRKAADQNWVAAQSSLADRYRQGVGATKDLAEAYKWSLLAASRGDYMADLHIAGLEREMTRQQIAEGKRRAVEWIKRPFNVPGL